MGFASSMCLLTTVVSMNRSVGLEYHNLTAQENLPEEVKHPGFCWGTMSLCLFCYILDQIKCQRDCEGGSSC